jgi:hypothetical protein
MSDTAHTVDDMRILHTGDWHIGRTFHGHATLDALRGVLEALTAQVREHDVDVVRRPATPFSPTRWPRSARPVPTSS